MIKLYGLKMSNYYSLVKAILIEKGIDFEEVKAPPTQEEDNLQRSPMGKMPSIEVDGNYLSESLAIARYAEQVNPTPALLPSDPFGAAKVVELVCHLKLDVELTARRCLPVLCGQTVSDETKKETEKDLTKGMKAVSRLFVCDPYAAGKEITLADFYTFYTFSLANTLSQKLFEKDLLADHSNIQALVNSLASHPSLSLIHI